MINNNYIVQNKILERKNKNYLLDKFNHHEVILNNDIVQNVNENKNKNKIENNQKNESYQNVQQMRENSMKIIHVSRGR